VNKERKNVFCFFYIYDSMDARGRGLTSLVPGHPAAHTKRSSLLHLTDFHSPVPVAAEY